MSIPGRPWGQWAEGLRKETTGTEGASATVGIVLSPGAPLSLFSLWAAYKPTVSCVCASMTEK